LLAYLRRWRRAPTNTRAQKIRLCKLVTFATNLPNDSGEAIGARDKGGERLRRRPLISNDKVAMIGSTHVRPNAASSPERSRCGSGFLLAERIQTAFRRQYISRGTPTFSPERGTCSTRPGLKTPPPPPFSPSDFPRPGIIIILFGTKLNDPRNFDLSY
jgi:hypothetical protein